MCGKSNRGKRLPPDILSFKKDFLAENNWVEKVSKFYLVRDQ